MTHYIIDGNNLIGRSKMLKEVHSKDKQRSRAELVSMLNSYFAGKKLSITLHLDGFKNLTLSLSKGKIVYSDKQSSDTKIREEISKSRNPKLITLVSSDRPLADFARVNSCSIVKSEDFIKMMDVKKEANEEVRKIRDLENEKEFFRKIFNSNK